MNQEQLYQLYLQQLAEKQAERNNGGVGKIKGYANKVNDYGNKLSLVGNAIKDNINNSAMQKLGSTMSNIGNSMSNGANAVTNTLNKPANYFKGFAGQGLQNAGSRLATQGGVLGTLGNGISSLGTTIAGGTGAGLTSGAAGSAGTGAISSAISSAAPSATSAIGSTLGAGTTGAGALGSAGTSALGSSALGSSLASATGAGSAAGMGTAGATSALSGATSAATSAGAGAAAGGSAAGGTAAAGPIGALVALGAMALQGSNRKRAKQGGQALLNQTNQLSEAGNKESDQRLQQTQQNSEALQQQSQQALNNGIMTGGAAQIQDVNENISDFPTTKEGFAQSLRNNGWDNVGVNSALNGLNNGNKEMSDYINYYNSVAQDGQQISIPQTEDEITKARALAGEQNIDNTQTGSVSQTEQVKRGLLDKFMSGISDFSRGYDENRNNAFTLANLQNNQFADTKEVPNETLVNYQNDLRNQGVDENVINAVAQGKNSGNKDIANWISNNQAAFQPQTETTYTDKSKMARLGEAMGTIGRMVNKPAVQALLAGGISTALTGNPLYGVGMAAKYGGNRAMSNIYQDALAKQGIQANSGMFGQLSASDMNALMQPQYKDASNQILKAKLEETQRYHDLMMQYYNDKMKETHENNVANQQIKATNAQANVTRAANLGKKSGGRKTTTTKSKGGVDLKAIEELQSRGYRLVNGKWTK